MPISHYPTYFWHPTLHERWAGESLHYYRFAFLPKLEKHTILKTLREVFETRGITSYSWNETYGSIDLILRLWLRPEQRPEVFHNDLRRTLAADQSIICQFADSFHVEKIYHHWRWQDIAAPPIDRELIADVNNGRKTNATKLALKDHLIKAYDGRQGRIHFYIGIPNRNANANIKDFIPPRILKRYEHHTKIKNLSIYIGTGGIYEILLEADVLNEHFGAIAELSDYLNELGCHYGVKTETHLVTGPTKNSFLIADTLSVPRTPHKKPDPRPYQDYATAPESNTLEKKATAYTDLHRYLTTGEKHRDHNYLKEGPLKALVGMLHSSGGEVIIGLLEDHKLPKEGAGRLAAYERIGDCYIVGIEEEENFKSWDSYEQQLRQTIDKLISPKLAGTELYQLHRIPAGKVSLALITISPAAPTEWYAIEGKLYVRDGNRTLPVTPGDLPRYQRHRERRLHNTEGRPARNGNDQ